jgi:hypothetical protein
MRRTSRRADRSTQWEEDVMRKWLLGAVAALAIVAIGGYAFREPLFDALAERMTANMFVASDTDSFDPGLAVGERLPALHAIHRGREIDDIGPMMGAKGLALFLNRSVDW